MKRQLLVAVLTLAAVACGSSSTPTAPASLAVSAPVSQALTATILGTVSGGDSAGMTVEVDGAAIRSSVGTLGQFALNGVPAGAVTLLFTGAGANARLAVGTVAAGQTLSLDLVVSGTSAGVRPPPTDRPAPSYVELEGTISDLAGNARAFQFVLQGRLVKGDWSTGFAGGDRPSFESLANGVRVHVAGSQQDGFIQAERIHFGELPKRPDPGPMFELRGAVSRLDGRCPAISFVLGGTVNVQATASTEYFNLECGRIANGDYVKVAGARDGKGVLIARAIGK